MMVVGPGSRRTRGSRQRLSRGHVVGALLGGRPRRGRHAHALPRVLVPGRRRQPRHAGGARARSTRAASWATRSTHAYGAAFDNPGSCRLLRRRRRRGRDRAAGRELALEQVPEPGARRRRAAHPASERLQDRQPDRSWRVSRKTSCASCSRATATSRCSCPGDEPAEMHRAVRSRRSTRRSTRSRRSSARPRDGCDDARSGRAGR